MRNKRVAVLTILLICAVQLAHGQHRHTSDLEFPDTALVDSSGYLDDCLQPDVSLPPLPEDTVDKVGADYYCAGCKPLRIEGEPAPTLGFGGPSPGKLRIIPGFRCIKGYAWAGISMGVCQQFAGFSADSKKFIRCDHRCKIIDIVTGDSVDTIEKQMRGVDGSHISKDSAIAPVLEELGAPAKAGPWLYDDLILTWSITRDCRAVTVYLVETGTGVERAIARVADDRFTVFPSHVLLSPDSRWLAVVFKKIGGPPIFWEPVIVDADRAAATLYAKISDARGKDPVFTEKARQACARTQ